MSSELMHKIESARAHVEVGWTDERAQTVGRRMARRKRRREVMRAAGVVVASLIVLLVAGVGGARLWSARSVASVASAASDSSAPPAVLKLSDGSVVTPLDGDSLVRAAQLSPTRVVVELARGTARFEVSPNPARVFRVEAGLVAVEVLGTSFTVERLSDDAARVSVQQGRVRVSWAQQAVELGAGQDGVFPRAEVPAPVPPAPPASVSTPAPTHAPPPVVAHARSSWRTLHQEGDFDKAWEALQREGIDKVRDEPSELLAAADVARMSKHSAQAVGPLRRLLQRHGGDPRAPLAAFTLGRVLLDELGRPREAADAFAQARRGAMAEDALAREVEAWSRAGDAATARARAELYLKQYPAGRREKSVRRYGGLE